jgi:hypothetical protein
MWDLRCTKWRWDRFSQSNSVSPATSYLRLLHIHHLSSEAGTIGQLVADVPSGLSLTPLQETEKTTRIALHVLLLLLLLLLLSQLCRLWVLRRNESEEEAAVAYYKISRHSRGRNE